MKTRSEEGGNEEKPSRFIASPFASCIEDDDDNNNSDNNDYNVDLLQYDPRIRNNHAFKDPSTGDTDNTADSYEVICGAGAGAERLAPDSSPPLLPSSSLSAPYSRRRSSPPHPPPPHPPHPRRRRTLLVISLLALFLLLDLATTWTSFSSSSSSSSFFPAAAAASKGKKSKKGVDEAAIKAKCTVCRTIVTNFAGGLAKTAKSGYGGGNTAWEEKSLGKNSFAKSETRFIEIMEGVCDSVSGETDKFYCGNIVEHHEDDIEDWYQSDRDVALEQVLCVEALKVCCPYGSWGADCTACVNATSVFCNGRGECKGNGTRVGTGKCDCQWPYKGESCADCQSGYFHDEVNSNETHVVCEKCDSACGGDGCSGPGARHCLNCASGWEMAKGEEGSVDSPLGCVDVDECSGEESPCSPAEFCRNSDGSYSCQKCDQICDPQAGCTGAGASDCVSCRAGADWDADRKNCVVTDWQIYDQGLKDEKEEEEGGEDEEEEEKDEGEEEEEEEAAEKEKTEKTEESVKEELAAKLEALKKDLAGGKSDKAEAEVKTKTTTKTKPTPTTTPPKKRVRRNDEEEWRQKMEMPTDALHEEPKVDAHDEL